MKNHTQRTLVIVKPDGVQRALVGEIIRRFERVGLKIVGMKMVVADAELVRRHYSSDPNWKREVGEKLLKNKKEAGDDVSGLSAPELGDRVLNQLTRFMTAGPMVALVLEGAYAVKLTRKLVGTTEPFSSDVGTIRGDFVLDSYAMADGDNRAIRNIVHASSGTGDAEKEIAVWFTPDELPEYKTAHEHVLYDVNFDNVTE